MVRSTEYIIYMICVLAIHNYMLGIWKSKVDTVRLYKSINGCNKPNCCNKITSPISVLLPVYHNVQRTAVRCFITRSRFYESSQAMPTYRSYFD